MKRKGFTLIELLAVIVILAVIALIAVPITLNIIDKARRNSFKSSLMNMFRAAELYEAENSFMELNSEGVEVGLLDISNKNNYTGRIIRNEENELTLVTVGDKNYCASGTLNNLVIGNGSCLESDTTEAFNVGVKNYQLGTDKMKLELKATDYESGIKSYLYCVSENDTCNEYLETTNKEIELTDLKKDTSYNIYIKAKNGKDIINSEAVKVTLKTIVMEKPVCEVNPSLDTWSTSKTITCTYTKGYDLNYTYSLGDNICTLNDQSGCLTKDNDTIGTWEERDDKIILTRVLTENTTVYSKVSDGKETSEIVTIDITTIDNENPIAPIIETTISTKNSITITFNDNNQAGRIDSYSCFYGESEDNLDNNGQIIGKTCTFDNLNFTTRYYYQICSTSKVGKTSCSSIANKIPSTIIAKENVNTNIEHGSNNRNIVTTYFNVSDNNTPVCKVGDTVVTKTDDIPEKVGVGATYTVTCTSLTGSASIDLNVANRLYIYKEGNEFNNLTGGWVGPHMTWTRSKNIGSGSKNSDNIYYYGTSNSYAGYRTNKQIDITGYKKLFVDITTTNLNADYEFIAATNLYPNDWIDGTIKGRVLISSSASGGNKLYSNRTVLTASITPYNGSTYFFAISDMTGGYNMYRMWIEK